MRKLAASMAAAAMALGTMPAALADTGSMSTTSGADMSFSLNTDNNIVKSFLRTGAGTSGALFGDGTPGALIDLSAYMSHPCFMPVGEQEIAECTSQFGAHYDLHESLRNGALEKVMGRVLPAVSSASVSGMIQQMRDKVAGESSAGVSGQAGASVSADDDDDSSSSSVSSRRTLDERAARVWEYCQADEHRGACFGRYARLVHDTNLDIDETLGAIIGVRAGQEDSSSSVSSGDDEEEDMNDDSESSSRLRIKIDAEGENTDVNMDVESDASSDVRY